MCYVVGGEGTVTWRMLSPHQHLTKAFHLMCVLQDYKTAAEKWDVVLPAALRRTLTAKEHLGAILSISALSGINPYAIPIDAGKVQQVELVGSTLLLLAAGSMHGRSLLLTSLLDAAGVTMEEVEAAAEEAGQDAEELDVGDLVEMMHEVKSKRARRK